MSKLHFIGGEKGGVGKSVFARILAQCFIDHEVPFVGFDTDKSHGSLLRFYADFASPVVIDQYESMDRIIEAASEGPEQRVLVDLAAQTQPALVRWLAESGVLDLAPELGLSITYWHVMDSGRDSVNLLTRLLDQFGGRINLVIVLNEIRSERFEILEASGELERAKELGVSVIRLRHLQDTAMQKIDANNSSFWAAINHTDKAQTELGLLERQRVKMWLAKAYAEIEPLDI